MYLIANLQNSRKCNYQLLQIQKSWCQYSLKIALCKPYMRLVHPLHSL